MNLFNHYWYFKSAIPEHICDDIVKYGHQLQDQIAVTGGYDNKKFPFCRTWDKLTTYVVDHIHLKHNVKLINKETWGNIYKPSEITIPLLNIDPVDLRNSPDFTLLYGVKVKDCMVRIHYEDNRRKGRSWDIELKDNMFIMFPSTNMYYLTNNQKDSLNFVQTITYESI